MADVKILPSSKESEEALLGAVITGGGVVYEKIVGWIREPDAFYYTDNKIIWEIITELIKNHEPADEITIISRLKEKSPKSKLSYYITGLRDRTPTTANAESYAKIIWEKYIQRLTAKSAYKIYRTSFDNKDETAELLNSHGRLVEELRILQPSKKRDIESVVDEAADYVKTGNNIIPFGMLALDAPAGGMTRKEVSVLGGRPGHGKTTLIVNIVRCLIEQDYKVMMFNREMTNVESMKKIVVMESTGLSYGAVRKGKLIKEAEKEYEITSDKIKDKYKNLIMYDDVRTLDEAMVEISRYKPDVIFDDYIQLITMKDNRDRRFQLEEIMQEYKWICKKENCSAMVVSQLNREIERRVDPKPRMSDYAESGVIEQTAESAIFIFYPYNFNDQENSPYETEIISAKTRYGRIGSYRMGFNGNRCKFYNTSEEAQNDKIIYKNKPDEWLQDA
tara:strand:- start:1444 stop:2790 length:1347 start_codon:yes stop_codon:yes gene_type:complete